MDVEREQVLRQLTEAAKEGIYSEAFYQAAQQALRLRPVPKDLLKELTQELWRTDDEEPSIPPEKQRQVREAIRRIYGPSARALDPNNSVGAVAESIRAALGEFQPWQVDWSGFDPSKMIQNISDENEKALSFMLPPGFAEGSSGSYISAIRTSLIQDEDGSVCTPFEFLQKKGTLESYIQHIQRGKRLSDTLSLLWKEASGLDVGSIEQLLRQLSEDIVPGTPVDFCSYDDPRHCAALRMRFGDNPIPAATGGVLNSLPGVPKGVSVASIQIFLEPWAATLSGQIVELAEFPRIDSLRSDRPKNGDEGP